MNTSKNEFLSALLDDEAGEFERRRLLDELNRDDESGQTLNRYALIGEAMRAKENVVISDSRDFLAGIHAGLEDEPDYDETVVQLADKADKAKAGSWRNNNTLRYGMAASVAVAAVAGVLLLQPGNQSGDSVEMAAGKTTPSIADIKIRPAAPTQAADSTINLADSSLIRQSNQHMDRETRDALKQYITLHMQHRANNGIVPSIQAAAYSQ